ncbi:hypothetical protein JW835_12780 [bacterium]|nr:hypothetical protein [bacterium]
MEKSSEKIIVILTIILSLTLAIVSYFGAFVPDTYARDEESMAVQGMGQDLVGLFAVVPLLLVSLALVLKHRKTAYFIFCGTVFYILYSFFIYSFGVHFNRLFLLYCVILGTSLYIFILILIQLNRLPVDTWFSEKTPARTIGIYLIIIACMFYLLWLKDVIPAIMNNTVPETVSNYNLLVNPVHVLDMAIVLPGLVITAVLLMKKNRLGLVLTPVLLVFILILAVALAVMVIMMKIKGVSDDTSVAGIFTVIAVISTVILLIFLKSMKKSTAK